MKSVIRRCLFVGISLTLAALTILRFKQEQEIQGSLENPGPDPDAANKPGGKSPANGKQSLGSPHDGEDRTNSATTVIFSGTVVRNGRRFALRETAGVLYPLDSAGRAWPFEGEDVRVTGKLDLSTLMLHVDAIESAVL
ncbi:MAG TPA: DUF5818 domain-containing protein [Terracidiphilus sp.]|jgi:hypothetical protein|nr:DUF5818 domain-containing protein [Terracidiphilus sp.]